MFVGQGSNHLDEESDLIHEGWRQKLKIIKQKPHEKLSHQAQSVARKVSLKDQSFADVSTEVLIGHSSGIIRALIAATAIKTIKKVVLVCPGPIPGMAIPSHLVPYLLRPYYLSKVLKGEEFKLDMHTSADLLLNNLKYDQMAEGLELMTPWSGKIVRQMLLDFIRYAVHNTWYTEVKNILHDRGVEIVVIAGTKDKMIPVSFASCIAKQLGANVRLLAAHHMLMIGDDSEYNFQRVSELARVSK